MTETTTGATLGQMVKVHYRGTLEDGTEFDNSRSRGEPISFMLGAGEVIPGFEHSIVGMEEGESKTFTIQSTDAYGDVNPNAFAELPKEEFPEDFPLAEGSPVPLTGPGEQPFMGIISEVTDDTVRVDLNHPMAGKDLTFEIELVEVTISDEDPVFLPGDEED